MFCFVNEHLRWFEYKFLIAVKKYGQVFSIFFNTSFQFGELKAFLASIGKTGSAEFLLYWPLSA